MSERIIAVVPVRSLRNGKTRLSPVLDPDARRALLRQTAERVISSARDSGTVEAVLVVSPDPEVLAWAAEFGRAVVAHPQNPQMIGLNGAIGAGRAWALERDADAILSLFADLPFLTPDDVNALTEKPEPVVLGADRRGAGTNALLLRLAGLGTDFQFAFGEESLARHLREARRLGLRAVVHTAAGVGFDLDTPLDWTEYLRELGRLSEMSPGGARSEQLTPRDLVPPLYEACVG
jgi:2-phospho-L-lactate guanylyltransferase